MAQVVWIQVAALCSDFTYPPFSSRSAGAGDDALLQHVSESLCPLVYAFSLIHQVVDLEKLTYQCASPVTIRVIPLEILFVHRRHVAAMPAPRLGTVFLLKSILITERLSTAVEKAVGPIRTLSLSVIRIDFSRKTVPNRGAGMAATCRRCTSRISRGITRIVTGLAHC